ncbi:MAG: FKBP-type peptidyl-prolyl cis-trans isomerase [Bacteroidia bacterium]
MKKLFILYVLAGVMVIAACNKLKTTEEGISYKIFVSNEDERAVQKGDMLQIHMIGKTEDGDSVIFDSYKNNKPFYIPAEEPTLKSMLALLHKNDSAMFKVSADSLYNKSFGSPRPPFIKEGENLVFYLKLVNLYNQTELQQEIDRQNMAFIEKDSVAMADYVSKMTDVKQTASGIFYKTIKPGKGKKPVKGQKVQVKYKGMLLDGTVFDETKEGQPDFTFNLGLGQVIQGWDEVVALMQEGEEIQTVIPWRLAYGDRGMGPIPQFSSLVFNIELIKVN